MSDFTPLQSFGPVPEGWIWGAATAAHQIEGGNVNNDWWAWEHNPESGTKESSGDACDSWNRWLEDLQLAQKAGLDSYRFSLEWSRIEPAPGEFSIAALGRYRDMLVAAHEMGLITNVTLHHFTTPLWLAQRGGWTNPDAPELFARYAEMVVQHLGDHMDLVSTFNEPNVVAAMGYIVGMFPPGHQGDRDGFETATANIAAAHEKARDILRAGPGDFKVGLTIALTDVVVHPDNDIESEGLRWSEWPEEVKDSDNPWLKTGVYLDLARDDDYVGVQTYFTTHLGDKGQPLDIPDNWRLTQIGWTWTPESLGHTVRQAAQRTGVPVIVTENGIATEHDPDRIEYYSRSLAALRAAMDDGVDVRGFYAWSLLDNFEWAEGYGPKFGLTEVDPVTFARTPKPSFAWYSGIVAGSRG